MGKFVHTRRVSSGSRDSNLASCCWMTLSILHGRRSGIGGGCLVPSAIAVLLNSIVARNDASSSAPDVSAFVSSLGHNLIGKTDGSSGWIASDFTGNMTTPLDPQLGPLHYSGGSTPTMALLRGSAAIDGGDDSMLGPPDNIALDQRGGSRRIGTHVDIGAVEMGSVLRITNIRANGPQVDIFFTTESAFPFHVESKDSFAPGPWMLVPGSSRTGNGAVLMAPDTRPLVSQRFYRAVMTP
jgi:hypothetical protein